MTEPLRESLAKWRFFEECLIDDIRPVKYGFGLDLVMNYVWDGNSIRPDVITSPRRVTIRLLGLESLHFAGGLTEAMKAEPELIGWGLTEVAQIQPLETTAPILGISVLWEGARRIDAKFLDFKIFASE